MGIDAEGEAAEPAKHGFEPKKVLRMSSSRVMKALDTSRAGLVSYDEFVRWIDQGLHIEALLDGVISRALNRRGRKLFIKVGDKEVDYNPDFRFYLTTVIPNPHYAPETVVKVNLLNFMATVDGLQDQMLGIAVAKCSLQFALPLALLLDERGELPDLLPEVVAVTPRRLPLQPLRRLSAASGREDAAGRRWVLFPMPVGRRGRLPQRILTPRRPACPTAT